MARVMEIETPLGADMLLFHAMHASEELSRVSEYQIDLLSTRCDIDLDQILGQNVTVKLALSDDQTRCFNGYVTRFAQAGMYGRYYRYFASVRPWLWFLTRTADCRIFQNATVPEILKTVFADHDTAEFKLELTQTYAKWTYCVQYRETDFNFVSRLMEHEGIYYYFRHSDGHNTLVLTDSSSGHSACPGTAALPFIPPDKLVRPEVEHVSRWEFAREIQPGAYVHDDFDMERPGVELLTQKTFQRKYVESDYEIYDYPGGYLKKPDGESYAGVRLDELSTQYERAQAATNARGLTVGYLFNLERHVRGDQNGEHLVVSASHDLEYSGYEGIPKTTSPEYACTFTAMSSAQQFRPGRSTRKPFVQGPQTAVVVGPAGDEIHTDKYGRVKVQFHWDRYGKRDQNSSCWIRVSHPWAGKGWGAVATPRIGQEVIVDFLEGDPDQPIITGRVYNADCQPPFGFPAGAVTSGVKSDTHKGSGYNELSMDDTAGAEKITIHGQFDMNTSVEHNQTTNVEVNRTDRIGVNDSETVGANQTIRIGGNQAITVGGNRTDSVAGSEVIAVGAHRTETVGGGETVTVNAGRSHTVNGVQSTTISAAETHTVGGARAHTVGAAEAITVGGAQVVSIGGAQDTNIGGAQVVLVGAIRTVTVGGPHKLAATSISETSAGPIKIRAGATATIEAPAIILKAGGSKITMNAGGITIQGSKVTVKADGAATIKGGGGVKLQGPTISEN